MDYIVIRIALPIGRVFLFFSTMSTTQFVANPLINDMLQERIEILKADLVDAIKAQKTLYEEKEKHTVAKMLGERNSPFDVIQHFKYQATVANTLREMERTYLKLFGKPWDLEEPVKESAPVTEEISLEDIEIEEPKAKRGRPSKRAI